MRNAERGMTMLGMLLLAVVVGSWIYAGIRLVPKYLEYMKVAATLEKVRDEYASNPQSTEFMLRHAIERHFDIESVTVIGPGDVEIRRDGGTFHLRAAYEDRAPLVTNVSLVVEFDKSVEIVVR